MSDQDPRHRIGIFGGSFNPIHVGHLLLAEQAREQLQLEAVRFVPAAVSPLKQGEPKQASPKQRLEMVQLATSGHSAFEVDDREIRRAGVSYTVDTLRELRSEQPNDELIFLMGADSLIDFHRWHEPAELCRLAFVAVLERGGHPPADLQLLRPYLDTADDLEAHRIRCRQIEVSSSDLRVRIAAGRSTRYQLSPAVEAYIAAEQLYQSEPA